MGFGPDVNTGGVEAAAANCGGSVGLRASLFLPRVGPWSSPQ